MAAVVALAPFLSASAQITTSAELNGTGNLSIPTLPALGASVTVEGWVKPASYAPWQRLVEIGSGSPSHNIVLAASTATGGTPRVQVFSGSTLVADLGAASEIPLNVWTHLAAVVSQPSSTSATSVTLYVNGQSVASTTFAGQIGNVQRTSNFIGKSNWRDDSLLNGSVADVRIWSVARTQAQIQGSLPIGSITGATSGLVAAYPFGATGQPVLNDVSGNNRTLTPSGAVLYQTAGPASPLPGPAEDVAVADLNAVGYLQLPSVQALGSSVTMEAWVWVKAHAEGQRIIDLSAAANTDHLNIHLTGDGKPVCHIWSGASIVGGMMAPTPVPIGVWTHVAAVLGSDRSMKLYVNGQEVRSSTSDQAIPNVNRPASFIGKSSQPALPTFNGMIADVRVWTAARTVAQVQSTMPVGSFTGPATGLLAAYPFGHTGHPTLNDISGNNQTLTQVGNVAFRSTAPTPPRTSSARLDGASSLTMGSTAAVTGAFTVEGWVRPASHRESSRIVDYGGGTDNILLVASEATSGKPQFIVNRSGSGVLGLTAPDSLPLNVWSHVAGVINSDRSAALYVNGRLVASGTATALPNVTGSISGLIGGNRWVNTTVNGGMADVRIWSVGRTLAEIQSSMPVGSITGATTGLVAAYPFGATGQAPLNDVSGNNRTLTASGAVQFQIPGPSSPTAAASDSTVIADLKGSAYYTMGAFPAWRDFTIEAWVNPRGLQGWGRIVDLGNAGYPNDNLLLMFADGSATKPVFWVFYGTDASFFHVTAPDPIPLNAWSHIAGTIDSSGVMRVFVNGRQVASGTAPRAANLVARSNNRIGANSDLSSIFNGSIADVRIWNYARTEAQIQSTLPVGSISGPAVGLMRAYPLGSTGAEVLLDITLSGGNLTQVGSPEYRKTGSGFLAAQGFQGSASLVTSAGQLTLPGNNPYTGTTTIGGGTLQVGAGGTTGSLGTGNVANNGILTFNRSDNFTVPNAISGSGSLFKQGAGALTLSGANSFTGGLTVQAGSVALTGEIANNAANTVTVNSGATFSFNRHDTFGGHDATAVTPFVVQSGGVLQNGGNFQNVLGPLTLQGGTLRPIGRHTPGWSFALRGKVTVDGGSVSSIIDGPGVALGATIVAEGTFEVLDGSATDDLLVSAALINGPAIAFPSLQASGLVKTGAGRMTLTGANAYTGTTTISAGTLQVGNGGTTGTLGSGNVVNNATLAFNRSDNVTVTNAISGSGSLVQQGSGIAVLVGANSYTGVSTVSSGTLQVGNGASSGSLGSGNVVNNAALVFNRSDNITVGNVISGGGSFSKQGPGRLTLTAASPYTGSTIIGGGTLALSGSGMPGSAGGISISNGATLDVSGRTSVPALPATRPLSNGAGNGFLAGSMDVSNGMLVLTPSGTEPPLTVTSGTLTVSAATGLQLVNTGPPLGFGLYRLLGKAGAGMVGGTAPTNWTLQGAGIGSGMVSSLGITGGELVLKVATPATVTLGGLSQVFNGSGRAVTATTIPAGLSVSITYNGSATPPVAVGSYPVVATITDASHSGGATGTLVISKGTASIALGSLLQSYDGTARKVVAITEPQGLAWTATYNGIANAPTNLGLYSVVATITDSNYQGSTNAVLTVRVGNPGSRPDPTPNVPAYLSHHGFLADEAGNPLGSPNPRNYDVLFRIFAASAGGSPLWTERQIVTVDQGAYDVILGEGSSFEGEPWPALDSVIASGPGNTRFLAVTVRAIGTAGADVTMSPRFLLASQPYAFLAGHARTASVLMSSDNKPVLRVSGNSVGIVVEQANATLDVGGIVTATQLANEGNAAVSGAFTAVLFEGAGTIPVGGIVIWTGTTPPDGWALCDGRQSNGRLTPDLRSRFVLGQGHGDGLASRVVGQVGGAEQSLLAMDAMPSHTHVFDPPGTWSSSANGHSHSYVSHSVAVLPVASAFFRAEPDSTRTKHVARTEGHAAHGHGFAVPGFSREQGGNRPHPAMPPFYALAYIMRVR